MKIIMVRILSETKIYPDKQKINESETKIFIDIKRGRW